MDVVITVTGTGFSNIMSSMLREEIRTRGNLYHLSDGIGPATREPRPDDDPPPAGVLAKLKK